MRAYANNTTALAGQAAAAVAASIAPLRSILLLHHWWLTEPISYRPLALTCTSSHYICVIRYEPFPSTFSIWPYLLTMEEVHSSCCPASSSTVLERKAPFSIQPSYSQEFQRAETFRFKSSASLHPGRQQFVRGRPRIIPAPSILRLLVQGLKYCPRSVVSHPLHQCVDAHFKGEPYLLWSEEG